MTDLDPPDRDDLDARLTDLLARSATAVVPHHDLDAVTRGEVVVRLTDRPARTRRHLALAAAAVLVLLVVGTVALAARAPDPTTIEQATAPGLDDLFPVLGDGPSDADGAVTPNFWPSEAGPPGDPVQAIIGRTDGDRVSGLVLLQVPVSDRPAGEAVAGTPTVFAGRDAWIDRSRGMTSVAIETDPILLVTGSPDAVDLLGDLGPESLVTHPDATGPARLEIGPLPPGLSLLAPPFTVGPPTLRSVDVERPAAAPDVEWVGVTTSTDDPFVNLVRYGSARRTSVNGTAGWAAENGEGATVTWAAANGTTVAVDTRGGTAEDALALARSVRLVDEATWRAIYGIADDDTAPTTTAPEVGHVPTTIDDGPGSTRPQQEPTSTTAIEVPDARAGEPAPPYVGTESDLGPFVSPQDQGEWAIVTFVASWCVPCGPLLDTVAEYREAHPDGPGRPVTLVVDDGPEAADHFLAEHGVDWPVLHLTDTQAAAWTVQAVPETVIVDADGIVRARTVAPSAEELESLLDRLGAG